MQRIRKPNSRQITKHLKVPTDVYQQENSQFVQLLLIKFFRIEFFPKIDIELISLIKRLCKCCKFVMETEENELLQNPKVFRRLVDRKRLDILFKFIPWNVDKTKINAQFLNEVAYACVQIPQSTESLPLLKYIVSLETQIPYWKLENVVDLACMHSDIPLIQYLVSIGNDPTSHMNRPIRIACERGRLEVVKYLCSLKSSYGDIDISARRNEAFFRATTNGHLHILKYLVSQRNRFPFLNPGDMENRALVAAVDQKNLEILQYIISLHSTFPKIDPSQPELLEHACESGFLEIVKYLFSISNQFPEIVVGYRLTFSFKSAAQNNHKEIVEFMFSEISRSQHLFDPLGGKTSSKIFKPYSGLLGAIQSGHTTMVRLMLSFHEKWPEMKPNHQLFLSAVKSGQLKMVRVLIASLEVGFEVDPTLNKNEAFRLAVSLEFLDIAKYLVSLKKQKFGFEVDPTDNDNEAFKKSNHGNEKLMNFFKELKQTGKWRKLNEIEIM